MGLYAASGGYFGARRSSPLRPGSGPAARRRGISHRLRIAWWNRFPRIVSQRRHQNPHRPLVLPSPRTFPAVVGLRLSRLLRILRRILRSVAVGFGFFGLRHLFLRPLERLQRVLRTDPATAAAD